MLGILKRMKKNDNELIMQAHFVALISLLETVFEIPMQLILSEIDV